MVPKMISGGGKGDLTAEALEKPQGRQDNRISRINRI
jgi:hypothetical protein